MKTRTIICVYLAVLLLIFATSIASAKDKGEANFNNAVKLAEKGEYQKAIDEFRLAMSLTNDSRKRRICVMNICRCYVNLHEYDKALAMIGNDNGVDSRVMRASIYEAKGDYLKAALAYEDHAGRGLAVTDEWNRAGVCYYKLGDLDLAIKAFQRQIEHYGYDRSDYASGKDSMIFTERSRKGERETYRNLAQCLQKKADYKGAIESYMHALSPKVADPANWSVYYGRGQCYAMTGEPNKAISDFTQAITSG